jgi:hypothetical protein
MVSAHRKAPKPETQQLTLTSDYAFDKARADFANHLILVLFVGLSLFFIPTLYFIEGNYELFRKIAFERRPGLVSYLDREIFYIRFFMFVSLCTCLVTSYRTAKKVFSITRQTSKNQVTLTSASSAEADSSRRVA